MVCGAPGESGVSATSADARPSLQWCWADRPDTGTATVPDLSMEDTTAVENQERGDNAITMLLMNIQVHELTVIVLPASAVAYKV